MNSDGSLVQDTSPNQKGSSLPKTIWKEGLSSDLLEIKYIEKQRGNFLAKARDKAAEESNVNSIYKVHKKPNQKSIKIKNNNKLNINNYIFTGLYQNNIIDSI